MAEDVRAHPAIRPARHRDERDQRHRHRAVGHRRQGRANAGLPAARRLPRPGRGLCQRRLLPGGQVGRRPRRRGRGLPRPRLQGHEDEDRPQPVDPDPSAPAGRPRRVLRGRARGGHRPGRRGAPGARAARQADGRRQLRLEPGDRDRDGPRDGALQALLDRGAGRDRRHRRQRPRRRGACRRRSPATRPKSGSTASAN